MGENTADEIKVGAFRKETHVDSHAHRVRQSLVKPLRKMLVLTIY